MFLFIEVIHPLQRGDPEKIAGLTISSHYLNYISYKDDKLLIADTEMEQRGLIRKLVKEDEKKD